MQDSDLEGFSKTLKATAEYYRLKEPMGSMTIRIWWEQLKGYDLAEVRKSFTQHMRTPGAGEFMPTVAHIIRWLEPSPEERARKAWDMAREGVRRAGHYQSVCYSDAMVADVIEELGGWQKLCAQDHDEMVWTGKDFMARYVSYCERGIQPRGTGYLMGLTDASNRANGLLEHIQPPVLIGDEKLALANYEKAKPALTFQGGKRLGEVVKMIEGRLEK